MERFNFYSFSLSTALHSAIAFALVWSALPPGVRNSIAVEIRDGNVSDLAEAHVRNRVRTASAVVESMPSSTVENLSREPIAGTSLGLQVEYPRLSRLLGEEGKVLIELNKSEANILSSSGHQRLDAAALLAVRNGIEVGRLSRQMENRISFVFKLTKASQNSDSNSTFSISH